MGRDKELSYFVIVGQQGFGLRPRDALTLGVSYHTLEQLLELHPDQWHPAGELYTLQISASANGLLVIVLADEVWLDMVSCHFFKNPMCKC